MSSVLKWIQGGVGRLRQFAYGEARPAHRPRVGLALAGGFARGIAHIGVLRVLQRNHIPVDCIAGTSVGALVGAAYASGTSLEEMEHQAQITRFTDFGRWTVSRMGIATNQKLEEFMARFRTVRRFENLHIPLAVATTDLGAAKTVYLTEGDLYQAVRASCAYPGLFMPIEVSGRLLVDGFVTEPVPVHGARQLGADVVIAVFLSTTANIENPKSVFEVIGRAFSIVQMANESAWRQISDVVIEPNIAMFQWDDFKRTPEMIAAGEAAATAALPAIRRALAANPATRRR
jgi:NTE family protein